MLVGEELMGQFEAVNMRCPRGSIGLRALPAENNRPLLRLPTRLTTELDCFDIGPMDLVSCRRQAPSRAY